VKKCIGSMILCVSVTSMLFLSSAANADEYNDFSFAVFGDNRLPGYFPFTEDQIDEIEECFEQVQLYAYGPEGQFDSQFSFDHTTGELDWFMIQPEGMPDLYTISVLKNGWPRLMLRGPGMNIVLRSEGQGWVYSSIIDQMQECADQPSQRPSFCLNTGDITYFGYFGTSVDESPFWNDFNERFLKLLPEGHPDGLPGRFFPAPGNHETWLDENLDGLLTAVPYLLEMGFTIDNRTYMFDYEGCRFIFLDTGDMDYQNPAAWGGRNPGFSEQMSILTAWLQDAIDIGSRQVFITFHNPAFCQSGFGPLPDDQNPHPYLKPFAADLNMTVFNGHVHTTELYEVDGIRYLVLGAGGGEQRHDSIPQADDYPEELYWTGEQRVEDYNYLIADVTSDGLKLQLHRYRPGTETPFESIEIFD